MPASAWIFHDKFIQKCLNGGGVDLDNNSLVVRLYSSASNINTNSLSDATAATNELSTANGYTAGGQALANPSVTESGGTTTFDADDVQWNASGGSITARYAAIIDTTLAPDEIIAHCVLDDTPADVTATDGNSLTIQMNASGIGSAARA